MYELFKKIREESLSTKQSLKFAVGIRPILNNLLIEFAERFGETVYIMPATKDSAIAHIGDVTFLVSGGEQVITSFGMWMCVTCNEENEDYVCNSVDDMIKLVLMMNDGNCKHLRKLRDE